MGALAAIAFTLEVQMPTFAIYSREGENGGVEYRLQGVFASPLDLVRRIVMDPKAHDTFPTLQEERLLGSDGAARIFYNRIHFPIVDDRDYCLRVETEDLAGGGFRQRWSLRPDCPPPPAGVVRMTVNEGSWELYPGADPRSTRFVMVQRHDPGGWLPRWLVRSGTLDQLSQLPPLIERAARRLMAAQSQPATAEVKPASAPQ